MWLRFLFDCEATTKGIYFEKAQSALIHLCSNSLLIGCFFLMEKKTLLFMMVMSLPL